VKKMCVTLLAAAISLVAYSAVANENVADSQTQEWSELSAVLNKCVGGYDAPAWSRGKLYQNLTPDGPFTGNGNFGMSLIGSKSVQDFRFVNSDMWTDRYGSKWKECVHPIPFGGLKIECLSPVTANQTPFRQEQNIPQAMVYGKSTAGFETRSWIAANDNVMVTELASLQKTPLSMQVSLWSRAGHPVFPTASGVKDGSVLWATRESFSGKRGHYTARWVSRVAAATRVLGVPATYHSDKKGLTSAKFTLEPGKTVRICTVMTGGKNVTTHLKDALERIAKLDSASLAALRVEHLAWWKQFWLKSYIRTHDEDLNKHYYGSLYFNACVSRAPFLPPGQYPLCKEEWPAWAGDYHFNQEYFGQNCWVYSANRIKQFDNFLQPIFDMVPRGRANAKNMLNQDEMGHQRKITTNKGPRKGVFLTVGAGPYGTQTHGFTGGQVSNASFTGATLVYWRYAYTKDLNWLREKGYPFLLELGDFWESHLILENGRYVSLGATHEGGAGRNPALDIGLIKFVMRALLTCSRDLGVDEGRRSKWQDILAKISDYPTMTVQGKRVFAQDEKNPKFCGCRACSAFIYPAEDVNQGSSKELKELALNFLSFSKSPQYLFPVLAIGGTRIGYSIETMVKHTKAGLFNDRSAPYNAGGRPNLSLGCFHLASSYLEFIHASMLQNEVGDGLRIFANWYKDRPAKFVRLRAKGAFVVSAEQDACGRVLQATILSEKGQTLTVINPWPGKEAQLIRSGKPAKSLTGDRFTIKTAVNETIVLRQPAKFVKNLAAGKKQTIVTMGTSLTDTAAWVSQLRTLLNKTYPGLVNVVNLGQGASCSNDGLRSLKAVVAARPDTVFIEFGMNDCFLPYKISPEKARNNLQTIIHTILQANPKAEIILQTMNSCKDYTEKNPGWDHATNRPKLAEYYEIYRQVARERKFRLIDHYPNWRKIMDTDLGRFDELVPDRIHPNAKGVEQVIMPTLRTALGL